MVPVASAQAAELELHIGYRTGVLRPVALQKNALLLGTGKPSGTERRKNEG